jgi:hypothetical protein
MGIIFGEKVFRRTVHTMPSGLLAGVAMFVFAFANITLAQTTTLTLQQDLSSKMPNGSAFAAKDAAGKIYRGHVVTHPAKWFLRRGSMLLVFDEPVVPVTKDREGAFRAGNKMRLLKLGISIAAGKLADDAVDTAIGATKARYVAVAVTAALILLQKGGEAKLHEGDTIEVAPRQPHEEQQSSKSAEQGSAPLSGGPDPLMTTNSHK